MNSHMYAEGCRGGLSGPEQICDEFREKLRDLKALRIFTAARTAFRAEVARAIDEDVTPDCHTYLLDYLDGEETAYHDSSMQAHCDELKDKGCTL